MKNRIFSLRTLLITLAAAGISVGAQAADLKVTLTNLAPQGGVGIAPLWVGFHDGSFDLFNVGQAASIGIERSAEDGNAAEINAAFSASSAGGVQGVLSGGPAFPGATQTLNLSNVDLSGSNRYFSYAAMVVVSNDFFVANENQLAFSLAKIANGGQMSILIGGSGGVYDAGTEVNDFNFSLANGAFGISGGQASPNQGGAEGGVVTVVEGNPYVNFLGQNHVPSGFQWGGLDFNAAGPFARIDISVSPVPEPSSWFLGLAGLFGLGLIAARRRQ